LTQEQIAHDENSNILVYFQEYLANLLISILAERAKENIKIDQTGCQS